MMNGNFSLYKVFVAGGITVTTSILVFMGNGVVDNEVRNVEQHREIRKELVGGDKAVLEKVDKVEDIVTDIRLEQTEQRALLNGIASKL